MTKFLDPFPCVLLRPNVLSACKSEPLAGIGRFTTRPWLSSPMPLRHDESFPRYTSVAGYITFFVALLLKSSEISKNGARCGDNKKGALPSCCRSLRRPDFHHWFSAEGDSVVFSGPWRGMCWDNVGLLCTFTAGPCDSGGRRRNQGSPEHQTVQWCSGGNSWERIASYHAAVHWAVHGAVHWAVHGAVHGHFTSKPSALFCFSTLSSMQTTQVPSQMLL